MDSTLFNWILDVTRSLTTLGNWLISPLPYLNVSPLGLFTPTMLTVLIGYHALRLVVGG